MPNEPRVSVLMGVHNGGPYLAGAVESILAQSYQDFEFIIVDDASIDGSTEILADYARRDERLVVLRNPENLGLTKSLNLGLKRARGEYIARQDADDLSHVKRLEKEVWALDEHPEAVLVTADYERIDAFGQVVGQRRHHAPPELIAWHLLFYNYLEAHSLVMFRRARVMALGGYDETRRYAQDYNLWLRLLEHGRLLMLPEPLLRYRVHGQNITLVKREEQDAVCLADSGRVLGGLIGAELPAEEVRALRDFWCSPFPPRWTAATIHGRLGEIYPAFVEHYGQLGVGLSALRCRLRRLIAARFIAWAREFSWRNPGQKAQLLGLAAAWSKGEVLAYLGEGFGRRLFRPGQEKRG